MGFSREMHGPVDSVAVDMSEGAGVRPDPADAAPADGDWPFVLDVVGPMVR